MNFNLKEFLFDNKTIKQTLIKNTFWYSLSQFASIAIKSLFIIWVARYFSIEEYGRFNIAMAFASMFVILADFGTSQILMREVAQEKADKARISQFFSVKFFLALLAVVVTIISSLFLGADFHLTRAIWIFAIYTGFYAFLGFFYYYFMGKNRMEYLGWSDVAISGLTVGLGFWVVRYHATTMGLALAYLMAMALVNIILFIFFVSKVQSLKLSVSKQDILEILKLSAPLAAVSFFAIVYNNIDSTVLGFYKKYLEAGYYNSALKIIAVSIMPAGLIASVFAPYVHKLFHESKEMLRRILDLEMEIMIFLAVGVLFGGWILAPNLIGAAYAGKYYPAVPALQFLLFTSIVFYFLQPFSQLLIASHNEKKVIYPYVLIALINVILDFCLIPRYGFMGPVWASVIALNSGLILMIYLAYKNNLINLSKKIIIWSFACALICALAIGPVVNSALFVSNNIFFLIIVGTLAYMAPYGLLRFVILKNIIKE